MPVVVRPGLIIVVDRGQVGIPEDVEQLVDPATRLEAQLPLLVQRPPAAPLLLILVAPWVPEAGLGLHVVEPDVLDARPVGPDLLAGHAAGVAADALVKVHDHADLSFDAHQYTTSVVRLRMVVTSSRCEAAGP